MVVIIASPFTIHGGAVFFINDEETIPDVEKSPTPSHAIHYMELKCKVVLLGS